MFRAVVTRNRLCQRFLIGALAVGLAFAGANELDKPTNTVGYANCFGNLQFTGHLGTIRFSQTEVYDFYYQYTSWDGASSPLLGQNFIVPLLESKLIDHDYFIQVTTLGGSTDFLYRLPAEPESYVSYNGRSRATRLGADRFVRTSPDGFQLEYRAGRLTQFRTPKNTPVTLTYADDGSCDGVRGAGGVAVVSVSRPAESQVQIETHAGSYKIQLQPFPDVPNPRAAELGIELAPRKTVASIAWPNGSSTAFNYELDQRELTMNMSYAGASVNFSWALADGAIRAAGNVRYDVGGLSREWNLEQERITGGQFSVRRSYPDGTWKSFVQNEDTGMIEEETSRSPLVRTHRIKNRGPTFNFIKKRERQIATTGEFETFYRAFYDANGNLLRQVSEGKLVHHLRENLELPRGAIGPDDDFHRYDADGRVFQSRVGGIETNRRFLQDGIQREVARYPWGEVSLRYFLANGEPAPIPGSETFPEGQQN
ncbi:MAG: hypothetical protein ACI8UO_003765 [Verrucomicrobiales bacterium]|jgi:hypothetical protein